MLELLFSAFNPFVVVFYLILLGTTLKGWLAPKMTLLLLALSFISMCGVNAFKVIDPYLNPPQPVTLHKTIFLSLEGISNKAFKDKLSKHIGYGFKRTGDFALSINYSGMADKRWNKTLNKMEHYYKAGSITVDIEKTPCIALGELTLPETTDDGSTKKEIEKIQEERFLKAIDDNIEMIATKIKACMDEIIN